MASETFLASVKKLVEQNLTIAELIGTADKLRLEGEFEQLLQLYKLWIQFNQESPFLYAALFNYATTLTDHGHLPEARACLERALALNPDFSPGYINLGGVLEKLGDVPGAIAQWTTLVNKVGVITGIAIEYKTMALRQIGRILEVSGKISAAEEILQKSLEINQHQFDVLQHYVALRMVQCQWPVLSPWEGISRKTMMKGISPLSMSVFTDDPMLQLGTAWNYNKNFLGYPEVDFQDQRPLTPASAQTGRRRIGYVSSDIRDHAVGYAVPEIFELHNRQEFEIFLYYSGPPSQDPVQARIKAVIDHWVDVTGLNEQAVAQRMLNDGIDILVDLNGYTKDACTKAFALRPAPIIVNWFGYPGTMGSPYHHYILADDWIIPQGSEIYYSEKVMRLPCYQPNDRKRLVAPRPSRSDVGLPENVTVFCCFNSLHKITRFTFERWMAILQKVPDSVLWLLSAGETVEERLRNIAAQHSVAAERIIFAPKRPNYQHLARYPLADLFLDTSPYGAHVTASDALWMGVPILTLSGRSFAARVCGSLTRAAGLPEMVCATPEEYVEKAVALGTDRGALEALKKKLEENRASCTLFDMGNLTRHLEMAYEDMWEEYRQGQLPQPDLTNLDVYWDIGSEEDPDAVEMLAVKDYHGLYKAKLARRHKYCPLHEDQRLWTARDISNLDENVSTKIKRVV